MKACFLYGTCWGRGWSCVCRGSEPTRASEGPACSHVGITFRLHATDVRSTLTAPESVSFVWEGASKRTLVQFTISENGLVDTKLQLSLTQSNKRALKGSYLLNYIFLRVLISFEFRRVTTFYSVAVGSVGNYLNVFMLDWSCSASSCVPPVKDPFDTCSRTLIWLFYLYPEQQQQLFFSTFEYFKRFGGRK